MKDYHMSAKIKVGIFFGGPSREREISFAGGRTVYDNLDKEIFEAVPIFVDSNLKLISLDWNFIYKGTIRDFYPPVTALHKKNSPFQIYIESLGKISDIGYKSLIRQVGEELKFEHLSEMIDIAFLALHGVFGEDGQIQGILESQKIPYTGSGILPCAIGMNKAIQKSLMDSSDFETPKIMSVKNEDWQKNYYNTFFDSCKKHIGFPLVVRPANQGSSIGVSILKNEHKQEFISAINTAFFRKDIDADSFNELDKKEQIHIVQDITDIRSGIGFPLFFEKKKIIHPDDLLLLLTSQKGIITIIGAQSEKEVIVESFISGKEFSCIVMRDDNNEVIALPPTEILKGKDVFDYRSKYLPGLSRKITPIDLPTVDVERIRAEICKLFKFLKFNVYARIDGFFTPEGKIFLNDPNTTSGMLPSSFFFHQAAEIGLNPSQFLSFLIRNSVKERKVESLYYPAHLALLNRIDEALKQKKLNNLNKIKVAVVLGGFSAERHISVESGRNIYEKLSSSVNYEPTPLFLLGNESHYDFIEIPIHIMLKDNADDIKDKILNFKKNELLNKIKKECAPITEKYGSKTINTIPKSISLDSIKQKYDFVFLALHGRPGEDGTIQKDLESKGIPYNGSRPNSASLTINKFDSLQLLKQHNFTIADQKLLSKEKYLEQEKKWDLGAIELPFIIKPVDDGCSAAVQIIKSKHQLSEYLKAIFREHNALSTDQRRLLSLKKNEEFPIKKEVLIESLISKGEANRFMEITVGLLTHYDQNGQLIYEILEPSETLTTGEVLSLEEKFLAGEGQNITPARFSENREDYTTISMQVKNDIEKAARILKIEGYARIDAFVRIYDNQNVETIIIEANSLPGMTPATCIFHQAALKKLKPLEFINKIISFGFERQKMRN